MFLSIADRVNSVAVLVAKSKNSKDPYSNPLKLLKTTAVKERNVTVTIIYFLNVIHGDVK